MKRLLWIGDAACQSGFANATHNILDAIYPEYEVHVLGLNYFGDGHQYPYQIYPAWVGGDMFGMGRIQFALNRARPDVIVIQNDGWYMQEYLKAIRRFKEMQTVPIIAAVAVDGKNFQGEWLKGFDFAIFWTQFALDESRWGGYEGPAKVIPLGVDLSTYRPIDKREARSLRDIEMLQDKFIIGQVNRNQHRKRWDLLIKCFSDWVHGYRARELRQEEKTLKITDAWLFLHTAPTGDDAINVRQLCQYYKVTARLALAIPDVNQGATDEMMALTYNSFDIFATTAVGEGMGLTAMEAMACGVPAVLPKHSAFESWATGAAWLVETSHDIIGFGGPNVVGRVVDESAYVNALDAMYRYPEYREQNSKAGLERVSQSQFRWANIGKQYLEVLSEVLQPKAQEAETCQ